jgi:hypothetical protein
MAWEIHSLLHVLIVQEVLNKCVLEENWGCHFFEMFFQDVIWMLLEISFTCFLRNSSNIIIIIIIIIIPPNKIK